MTVYYLDSSALFKLYHTEPGPPVIAQLFSKKTQDDTFRTSYLATLEVESAAVRALMSKTLTRATSGYIPWLFSKDLHDALVVLPVPTSLITEATQLVNGHALRSGDAMHLATAHRAKPAQSGIVLVASDQRLLAAGIADGFATIDPIAIDSDNKPGAA